MSNMRVDDRLTEVSPKDLFAALRAFTHSTPAPLSRASLILLVSQFALETGGGRACHNFNLGNVKKVDGDGHDWTMFATQEVIGGKVVTFHPPDRATWFRAYADLEDGVKDYYAEIERDFASSWPFVVAGDVPGFCHALKVRGYYTAPESTYTAGVQRWYDLLERTLPLEDNPGLSDLAGNANETAIDELFDPQSDEEGEKA
jgi:hypothetical protein